MRSTSRGFLSLFLGVLLALGAAPASAGPSLSGSSMGGPSGLTVGGANGLYLRLDGTNTMTAAITSSNGGFTATGATTLLTLTGGFVPTGAAAEIGSQIILTGNFAANDFAFRLFDNTSTALFSVSGDGAGFFTNYVQAANVFAAGFYSLDSVARFVPTAAGSNTYTSNDAADGSMVAHAFNTVSTAATTDKLLSIRNVTTEKVYFDPVGSMIPAADATSSIGSSTMRFIGYLSSLRVPVIADANGATRIVLAPTGATTINSALAATGGVDVGNIISVGAADYSSSDKVLSIQDNGGTELAYFTGDGVVISTAGYFSSYVRTGNYTDGSGVSRFTPTATGPSTYSSTDAADGSMTAHVFDTANLAATTDKLLSIKNQGTEKVYVSPAGRVVSLADVTAEGSTKLGGTTNGYGVTGGTTIYPLEMMGQMSDGAAAIAVQVNSTTTYANAAAKLFSIKNNGSEKDYFDINGYLYAPGFVAIGGIPMVHRTTSTAAGLNGKLYSAANAAGEYAMVVGSSATTTTQINFAVATDIDDTPSYVFEVDGLGNTSIGASLAAGQATRLAVAGAVTPAAGVAYGATVLTSLNPPNGSSGIMVEIDPTITATAGETNPNLTGLLIDGFTKISTGTVTTSYGLYVGTSTVGTNNIAISTTGIVQFGRVSDVTPTAPATCAAIYEGSQVFVDDTNDGIPGFMCICGTGADDSTYAWSKMNSNPAVACF